MLQGNNSGKISITVALIAALGAILAAYIGGWVVVPVILSQRVDLTGLPLWLQTDDNKPGTEPADISAIRQELESLRARVERIEASPDDSPSQPDPKIVSRLDTLESGLATLAIQDNSNGQDLGPLNSRLDTLEDLVGRLTQITPTTVERIVAELGLPARGSPLPIADVFASSTDTTLDANDEPVYLPEHIKDGNTGSKWQSKNGDVTTGWIELHMGTQQTITGLRFLSAEGNYLYFQDALISFSDGSARELHLTPSQQTATSWFYFPLVPDITTEKIRVNFKSTNPNLRGAPQILFAEIEVYGP